ncbi:putative hydrolase of the HAD superfamily [Streptosporangium becharense]|uniref:Putative hydrolase of the HAD superfamily n=1 Tax=Streptosporangium becharense TaxID=1816182 RepID=A0A7W9MFQ2_9ACTN|nr:HAD family phosphatase [Streptosporangium becharense]MBB2909747.1 putative hydrolase of the HAD superfamily [Streptosporangium becharense]MBB5819297.1 putative hydrolase of the HAD superfamily [Streptosporangium becharense]
MLKGVLIDWGGVLTVGLSEAVAEWIAAERLDPDHYRGVMRELVANAYEGSAEGENMIHALERGEISALDFERGLAARLVTMDGVPPVAEGLLARMFSRFHRVEPMYEMLREARAAGVRTCLLSNSWANEYPRDGWDDVFDEVVISGEVGMRKPEPRIFRHALGRIGLSGRECVFVDDVEANVRAARGLGIVGVHHRDPETTISELETLLRVPLR